MLFRSIAPFGTIVNKECDYMYFKRVKDLKEDSEKTQQPVKMTCSSCKNFRLHYIRHSRGNYSALFYGHCVKPRLKKRYADDKACVHWEERPDT